MAAMKRVVLLPTVIELAKQGKCISAIARELGVSISVVSTWVKREHIPVTLGVSGRRAQNRPRGLPSDGPTAAEMLRSVASYDKNTGEFHWIKAQGNAPAGKGFGRVDAEGYVVVSVFYRNYRAHRLAWLYVYGEWPTHTIDHINRVRSDNRIANLRDVSIAENLLNTHRVKRHPDLPRGISKTPEGTYKARIFVGSGKSRHLGTFKDPEAAYAARLAAIANRDAEAASQSI